MLSDFSHLLPEAIFEAVERLGGRCTGRFLALNAMENRVYDLEMEEGPRLVIKFYRPGRWSRDVILAEHAYLKAAAAAEIPVVPPVTAPGGETLLQSGEIFYAIFPKRPGRLEPELNPEQLQRLGRYLARLHNVGAAMGPVPRGKLTPETFGRASLQFLKDEKLLPGNLGNIYAHLVTRLCDVMEPLFDDSFETVLLHGDCHAGNVLWNGNEPYFIDFDDMLYAPPIQDCWMLIGGDDEHALKNRDILLDAYEEIREFDHRTLRLMEPLRALRMIYFSTWIARRRDDGAFRQAFPHFGTEKYWQEQIENLSLQLERVKTVVEKAAQGPN